MTEVYNFIPMDLYKNNKNNEKPVVASKDGKIWCFPSIRDAARLTNVQQSSIVACLKGRLKTAGGYSWKYADDFCSYGERREGE